MSKEENMELNLITALFIIGAILLILGMKENIMNMGRDFTGKNEMLRLRELNRRIKSSFRKTISHARNCFEMYKILQNTRYRNHHDPLSNIADDEVWNRARDYTLKSSKRAYQDCNKLLKISIEQPQVLLLMETYQYIMDLCYNCPIHEGSRKSISQCPVLEAYEKREQNNG
jgi:hypothetical protein